MRIAMVAPLTEAVPPRCYGGTERVVSVLTEELVRRGHRVTLFASGDSVSNAQLVSCSPAALRTDPTVRDCAAYDAMQLDRVYRRATDFDVIHNHLGHLAYPLARVCPVPTITTMHGRSDTPEERLLCGHFPALPRIAISAAQRATLPEANWLATVPNGIDTCHYRFRPHAGDYLVFLGRISPEKRPDRAIAIARAVGMPLIIAAKVDSADAEYYEEIIAPLIRDTPSVSFVGEVNEREKDELLGGAYAYLFPIDWPEPFGLTMVEAMATGTPVIAYRAGSVPEVVVDGMTGFICDSVEAMAAAIGRIPAIDRRVCRAHVERPFSAEVMTSKYERAYRAVVASDGISGVERLVSRTEPLLRVASD